MRQMKKTAFQCEFCLKLLRNKGRLKTHQNTVHDKIKDYKCGTCLMKFDQKRCLDIHQSTVHNNSWNIEGNSNKSHKSHLKGISLI